MRIRDRKFIVIALVVWVGAWGCGDNDNSGPDDPRPSAALQCEVMGTLCHDTEDAAGQACHEVGHDGPPAACAAEFPACIAGCLGDGEGDPFCRALGRLCHDTSDAAGQACHELGHDDDPAACRRDFDECAARCLGAE